MSDNFVVIINLMGSCPVPQHYCRLVTSNSMGNSNPSMGRLFFCLVDELYKTTLQKAPDKATTQLHEPMTSVVLL